MDGRYDGNIDPEGYFGAPTGQEPMSFPNQPEPQAGGFERTQPVSRPMLPVVGHGIDLRQNPETGQFIGFIVVMTIVGPAPIVSGDFKSNPADALDSVLDRWAIATADVHQGVEAAKHQIRNGKVRFDNNGDMLL
jgi:hypothetical protein